MWFVMRERPALEEVSHALAALRSVHGLEAFRKRSSSGGRAIVSPASRASPANLYGTTCPPLAYAPHEELP
jgi:hypothetical protein